jgi:hypothetical protein
MTGKTLICRLGKQEEIFGADRIAQVHMFGETVIVSKDYEEGKIGLLFDCETQLSHEYASANNLYRHSNLNADKTKSGYLEDSRRIRPIRLKGVRCSAMWMPITSLDKIADTSGYTVGQEIEEINGVPICSKYITQKTKQNSSKSKEGKVSLKDRVPTFKEHLDTDQWGRNSHKVKEGDLVIITEKLHGTSGRCGYLQTNKVMNTWYRVMFTLFRVLAGFGWEWNRSKIQTSYNFVVGSRRVVKSIDGNEAENKAHFYDEDLWTTIAKREFEGKLRKGETLYFEIVGYTPSGEAIMGNHNNSKLQKFMSKNEYKEFINKYGETTVFIYGCNETTKNKVFIYRITMTNEDGESIDLSWEQVKTRCEQLDVEHVPELGKNLFDKNCSIELLNQAVEQLTESDSKNFPQHINEGVCVRIENGSLTPQIYKSKRYLFKVLEGIIKDNPNNEDMEESN